MPDEAATMALPVHRTSGRRQRGATAPAVCPRDAPTTNKSKTVADAKAKFSACLSRSISVLMEECGYSRERAQSALLREIARGDNNPPQDAEIFQTMSSLGLGIEDAARALTVSKALQRETSQRGVSTLDAIDELTSKLSVANLICVDRVTQSTDSSGSCDSIQPRTSDVRIHPVPSMVPPRQTTKSACPTNFNTTTTIASASRKNKSINKSAKQKHGIGNRKRSAEDISTINHPSLSIHGKEAPNDSFQTRPRADSLTEVANAKLGDKKLPSEDPAIRPSALASPAVVRAKRGRVDDGEPTHTALKRSRAASDLN